jgi:hypothetical protein
MYKLTNEEAAEVGHFLRTLCRMDMINAAKSVARMSDWELAKLVRDDALWSLIHIDTHQEDTQ